MQKFTKEVLAYDLSDVRELILSELGSKHRTKRRDIKIERIEEISPQAATNPIVKQLGGKK
jgi:large subunit ribosomal protein LX